MIDLGIQTPAMLVQLEDDLGPQEVWDLVNAFGGRWLHLPSTLQSAQSTTREQVAPETFKWLFDRYGAGRLQIGMGPASEAARQFAALRDASIEGASVTQIAERFSMHTRTVERKLSRLRTAGFL